MPWKEVSEFGDDEFDGFCGDFEQNGQNTNWLGKGIENEEYTTNTFG